MNNTIGGFTTDREWVLDKLLPEDITYLDNYAEENNWKRRTRTIGIMDIPNAQRNNQYTKYYQIWINILRRCYSKSSLEKYPTYEFITISKDFHIFSRFYEIISTLYIENTWQLDKDFSGLNEYSKESIMFLPQYLNKLFLDSKAIRGNLPLFIHKFKNGLNIGVCRNKESLFTKYLSYNKSHSKEEALVKAFSTGITVKIWEVEKHIDEVNQMSNPPQEWKKQVISGLNKGIDKYNKLLKDFNPEDYSEYL